MQINISKQDLNTILAALRFYQEEEMCEAANRSGPIDDVATDSGQDVSMDSAEIDDLCVRLNLGEPEHSIRITP